MELSFDAVGLNLRLSKAEAVRLGIAIGAGFETVSRAEYFIRTGLSQPQVRELSRVLCQTEVGLDRDTHMLLEAGAEEAENPPRPR